MKKTVKQSLRHLSLSELNSRLDETQMELAKARLALAVGKLKNTHISLIADKVAVIKTIMREKQFSLKK